MFFRGHHLDLICIIFKCWQNAPCLDCNCYQIISRFLLVQQGLLCLQDVNTNVRYLYVSGKYPWPVPAEFPFFSIFVWPEGHSNWTQSEAGFPKRGRAWKNPTQIKSGKPHLLIARTKHLKSFFLSFSLALKKNVKALVIFQRRVYNR